MRRVMLWAVVWVVVLAAPMADAARYWVTAVSVSRESSNGTFYTLSLDIAYIGSDVLTLDPMPGRQVWIQTGAYCNILYTDTAAQIRTKVTDCVIAESQHVPNASGTLGVTVNRTEGWLPSFITGN